MLAWQRRVSKSTSIGYSEKLPGGEREKHTQEHDVDPAVGEKMMEVLRGTALDTTLGPPSSVPGVAIISPEDTKKETEGQSMKQE